MSVNDIDFQLPLLGMGTFPLKGGNLQECLSTAISNGIKLIDTAYKYQNEQEIGHYLKHESLTGSILVESKLSLTQLTRKTFCGITYSRVTPEKALKGTLRRLGVDSIDIYLLHSPNQCVRRYGELIKLREKGLVKLIGGCRMEQSHMEEIFQIYGEYPTINQIELHPYCSNKKLVDYCQSKGVIVEGRSPFAHGDLMNDFLSDSTLVTIANNHNKTVPQIILRWIIQQGVVAIPRSSNPMHIRENVDIFNFELTDEEMREIHALDRSQSVGCLSVGITH